MAADKISEIKESIKSATQTFAKGNLTENSIELFEKLGYVTERRAPLNKPTFAEFKDTYIGDKKFDEAKAKTKDWKYVDLLFQLSKEEVQKQASLFDTKQVDRTVIETYLFFAIELNHDEYSRTQLAVITREVNRLFPMPAMILFKHGKTITISAINRRLHKQDESKDVLEKVILIKDIVIENPHRAHIEILFDISFDELRRKHQFTNFVELHNAWQKTLDTKELNKRFFSELFNWYLWAVRSVNFPNDIEDDKDNMVYNSENVIRLLTRLIFVWFIKEKNLVPDSLFELKKLKDILKDFKPQSAETSVYYRAVLQNLFFATLNTPMDKDITAENKDEQRRFINTLPKTGNDQYLDQTKYRYQNYFTTPDKALELFSSIPFLNGGLFECLDFKEGNKEIRLDGFSSTEKRQAFIPDKLFFAEKHQIDLNTEYGTKNKKYEVEGLINMLDSYKFTITENTPLEEEIALDPELLGKVFENLLASYNPETQTTARKQTGSFYTPREIVNYMVDESLIAYFKSIVSIPAHVDNDNNLENEFFNPDNEIEIHQGNLPHWQQENVWYFITFRLADSIPTEVVEQIKQERELWLKKHDKNKLTIEQKKEYYKLFSERTENLLNAGKGSCVLKNEKIAKIVSEALLHFNNQRYILDEWVIMPNHVHILLKPFEGYSLPDILYSWKSFTANEINKEIGNKGQLWMHESYDHIVRNEKALQAIRRYIWDNPVKAGITLPSVCLSSSRSKDASFVESRSKDASFVESRSKDASDTFETKLRDLFTHVIDLPEFTKSETDVFIKAISEVKILDPACGSGAFPMGVLHRLVDLLNKLDPDNKKWNELQKQRAIAETAEVFESGDVSEREIRLNEINKAFDLSMNYPDYARKLFLIENCIYGVDIQQIAIQISKLRFFISLIVDQKVDDNKPNRNILSMPNLETKFVAANTLIGLDKPQKETQLTLIADDVEKFEKELGGIRRKIFFTRKYSEKKILKKKEKAKREELQVALTQSGFTKNVAGQMAGWNPFDPMQSAKFFDPETMFGLTKQKNGEIGFTQSKEITLINKQIEAINKQVEALNLSLKLDQAHAIIKLQLVSTQLQVNIIEAELGNIQKNIDVLFGTIQPNISSIVNEPIDVAYTINALNKAITTLNKTIKEISKDIKPVLNTNDEGVFDVVIGNPPYVNTKRGIEVNDKQYYKNNYITAQGQFDIFCLFIEKSFKVGNQVCFIVPKPVINNENYISTRELFFKKGISQVVIGYGIFESAGVESCIFLTNKQKPNEIKVFDYINERFLYKWVTTKTISELLPFKMINTEINNFEFEIIQKMQKDSIKLNKILKITRGIEGGKSDEAVTTNQTKYKLIRGEDLTNYSIRFSGFYAVMDFSNPNKFKTKDVYCGEKIMIRRVGNDLISSYDSSDFITLNTVYNCKITDEKFNTKYITSLLNSSALKFWFKKVFILTDKLFPYVRVSQLEFIPIKYSSNQQPFIALVDQILSAKAENPKADTSQLEKQIDEMVYKLYELTDEEIAIIEGKVNNI